MVLDGMLGRYVPLARGSRQIVALLLPGDIYGLHGFTVETMDDSLGALVGSTVALAPQRAIASLTQAHPRLGTLLSRDEVVSGAISRQWVVNCGRRDAYTRIAHLFCETYARFEEIGLVEEGGCPFLLTQTDLADAVGLSVVHVNRVLQRLRTEKLIEFVPGRLTILDWDRLAKAARFDASYLHASENIREPATSRSFAGGI